MRVEMKGDAPKKCDFLKQDAKIGAMNNSFGDEEPECESQQTRQECHDQSKIVSVQTESQVSRRDEIGMLTPVFGRFCAQIVFEAVVRHHGPRHQQRQVINIVEEIHGESQEGLRATSQI